MLPLERRLARDACLSKLAHRLRDKKQVIAILRRAICGHREHGLTPEEKWLFERAWPRIKRHRGISLRLKFVTNQVNQFWKKKIQSCGGTTDRTSCPDPTDDNMYSALLQIYYNNVTKIFLHCEGTRDIPSSLWDDTAFMEVFMDQLGRSFGCNPHADETEASLPTSSSVAPAPRRRAATRRKNGIGVVAIAKKPRNFELVLCHPRVQSLVGEISQQKAEASSHKREATLELVAKQLSCLPSVEVVSKMLGPSTAAHYNELLEKSESHPLGDLVDSQSAMDAGRKSYWKKGRVQNKLELLEMVFQKCANDFDVCDHFEDMMRREQRKRQLLISEASALGVWRVRNHEAARWQDFLGPERWSAYLELEKEMRQQFRGLFQYTKRRFFSASSVSEMDQNLERLRGLVKRQTTPKISISQK